MFGYSFIGSTQGKIWKGEGKENGGVNGMKPSLSALGGMKGSNKWKMLRDAGTPAKIRSRVQRRLQYIIACDVAGKKGNLLIDGDSVTVEIENFSGVLSKWLIPRGAKHAFRAVAFEALLEVGEKDFALLGENAYDKIEVSSGNN